MDAIVKARVNLEDKNVAIAVLREVGMNLSDLIRMAIVQTAKTKMVPVNLTLGAESLAAIREVEEGRAIRASREIFEDLPKGAPRVARGSA